MGSAHQTRGVIELKRSFEDTTKHHAPHHRHERHRKHLEKHEGVSMHPRQSSSRSESGGTPTERLDTYLEKDCSASQVVLLEKLDFC